MTDREAIKALVVGAYAARDRGDVEDLMTAFHSDAVFELVGARTAPHIAGAVEGHSNVRAGFGWLIEAFKFENREIVNFIVDDERAAVHSRIEVTFIPKNRTFTTEVLDLFKFKDGKVIELLEFADTALIKDVISDI
jgi:ketosteroid isomerase-like protein